MPMRENPFTIEYLADMLNRTSDLIEFQAASIAYTNLTQDEMVECVDNVAALARMVKNIARYMHAEEAAKKD